MNPGGNKYVGEWKNDLFNGQGTIHIQMEKLMKVFGKTMIWSKEINKSLAAASQ